MSSIWQKYKAISPRTRILVGAGVMAYATIALYVSDGAEKYFGLEASERDREELRMLMPTVRAVDREGLSGGVIEGQKKQEGDHR